MPRVSILQLFKCSKNWVGLEKNLQYSYLDDSLSEIIKSLIYQPFGKNNCKQFKKSIATCALLLSLTQKYYFCSEKAWLKFCYKNFELPVYLLYNEKVIFSS